MKTSTIHKKLSFTPDMLHQSVNIPYEVEQGVTGITLTFEGNNTNGNKINCSIYDPENFRGWKERCESCTIKEDWASPGFLHGIIKPGTWYMIFEIFNIDSQCDLDLHITYEYETPMWLKGDMHTHTVHSDGIFTIEEAVSSAKKQTLDFIALTDHNTLSQNRYYVTENNFTLIPGAELTTPKGHGNFYGSIPSFKTFDLKATEDVAKLYSTVPNENIISSINHPFCSGGWNWGFDDIDFECIEIWNGNTYERNKPAIDWWHDQLCKGRKITALGGSDFHSPDKRTYGQATTHVCTLSNSVRHIIKSVKNGHTCVSPFPNSSRVFISVDDYIIGDTFYMNKPSSPITVMANFELKEDCLIKFYSSNGCVYEEIIKRTTESKEFTLKDVDKFIRAELWTSSNEIDFITNPIYIEVRL